MDTWLKIAGIGLFHGVLYLYLVPFEIYPRFGDRGLEFALVLALLVSVAVLGPLFMKQIKKRFKGE